MQATSLGYKDLNNDVTFDRLICRTLECENFIGPAPPSPSQSYAAVGLDTTRNFASVGDYGFFRSLGQLTLGQGQWMVGAWMYVNNQLQDFFAYTGASVGAPTFTTIKGTKFEGRYLAYNPIISWTVPWTVTSTSQTIHAVMQLRDKAGGTDTFQLIDGEMFAYRIL